MCYRAIKKEDVVGMGSEIVIDAEGVPCIVSGEFRYSKKQLKDYMVDIIDASDCSIGFDETIKEEEEND